MSRISFFSRLVQDTKRGANGIAKVPMALLDDSWPGLRTCTPAARIVAGATNREPYEGVRAKRSWLKNFDASGEKKER
jgi:hypothetical protein